VTGFQKTTPYIWDVAEGRDPTDINFFPNIVPIVGRIVEEVQAKHDIAMEYAHWNAA